MYIRASVESLSCAANTTFWPQQTADILNYPQRKRATQKRNNTFIFRPVASIKWLGRLSEWPTLTPPPPFASVPRLKHTSWYMLDPYICLQYLLFLSLIFRLCWLSRNRELVWDIARRKFAKQLLSGCFFDYTRLFVTNAWFYPR